jgi:hypothetical protein
MRVASFTVGATAEQSTRWKMAAEADGHRAVGTWLAMAADLYLKVRARAGRPIPLAWHRGLFLVALESGEVRVKGHVSPPFGSYLGTDAGPGRTGCKRHTLVHLPSRQVIATLRTKVQVRALASELAPVWLRDRELAAGVVERHERESV